MRIVTGALAVVLIIILTSLSSVEKKKQESGRTACISVRAEMLPPEQLDSIRSCRVPRGWQDSVVGVC